MKWYEVCVPSIDEPIGPIEVETIKSAKLFALQYLNERSETLLTRLPNGSIVRQIDPVPGRNPINIDDPIFPALYTIGNIVEQKDMSALHPAEASIICYTLHDAIRALVFYSEDNLRELVERMAQDIEETVGLGKVAEYRPRAFREYLYQLCIIRGIVEYMGAELCVLKVYDTPADCPA